MPTCSLLTSRNDLEFCYKPKSREVTSRMTEVATPTGSLSFPSLDPMPTLLGYLAELIGKDDPAPLERVLHQLALHFAARGAGIASSGRLGFAMGPHAWVDER